MNVFQEVFDFIERLADPFSLIKKGGFYLILFVIYAETGLFFGFFLPGDYLLFLVGLFVATKRLAVNIYVLVIGLIISAILGNFTGYLFGKYTGQFLYKKPDTFFFKKRYLGIAESYYKKQGALALVMGRFIPIVRTFAPIFAGIIGLNIKKFTLYNILGAILWISSLTLLGYFLGRKFQQEINDYLSLIIIGFVLITALPLAWTYLKKYLPKKAKN